MAGLMDILSSALSGDATSQLSRRLGADERATGGAIQAALPMLLAALAQNASTQGGADALHRAIANDHDGSVLDDVAGQIDSPSTGTGSGILGHLLGSRQQAATGAIAQASGLDPGQASQLLTSLAPLVMGALGRVQRTQGLDAGGLASLVQTNHQQMAGASPDLMAMATQLLDRNGDGSIANEVMGGLSKLFGRS